MKWFKRISLFLLTNMLVLVTISIALAVIQSVFGINLHGGQMSGLMVLCAVWGMGGAFISLLISKFMAKRMMGVQIIDPATVNPREREIVQMVYNMATRAGLEKMPEVGIYESPEVNAFATGPSKKNSLVAVSTGLLSKMSKDEVEGVIGHEVAHIANGDMVTMTLIQGVVNAFVMFFARLAAKAIASQTDERSQGAVYFGLSLLFDIVFGLLGSILVAYFSRLREYRADAGGAMYAGKPKMIAGLKRLQSMYDQLEPDNGSMATMKISSRPGGFMAFFSTHPPLEERIRRLQETF
ncbi:MAG: protease HtpX [Bdellovibrio sp.]|jgi:heat shock protein HtpX